MKRERDPDNHRAWRLHLTPKGKIFRQLLEENATRKLPSDASKFYQTKKEIETYDETDEDLG